MPPMDAPMPPDMGNAGPPIPPDGGGEEPPMNAPGQGDDEMPDGPDDENMVMPEDDGNPAKKEIQKLAGKLSQKMSEYNSENGDDEELNKFVGGMIFKQLNLDDADKDSIMDKSDDSEGMDDAQDMEDAPDMEEPQDDNPPKKGKPMKAESIDRIIDRVISEIANDATDFSINDKPVFDRGTDRPDRKERTDASARSPFRGRRR